MYVTPRSRGLDILLPLPLLPIYYICGERIIERLLASEIESRLRNQGIECRYDLIGDTKIRPPLRHAYAKNILCPKKTHPEMYCSFTIPLPFPREHRSRSPRGEVVNEHPRKEEKNPASGSLINYRSSKSRRDFI